MTAAPVANSADDTPDQTLALYQLAKEQAARYNRNVLQYGGALASILAMATGSGSLFALAISIAEKDETTVGGTKKDLLNLIYYLLIGEGILLLAVGVPIFLLLWAAFAKRGSAEEEVDRQILLLRGKELESLVTGR